MSQLLVEMRLAIQPLVRMTIASQSLGKTTAIVKLIDLVLVGIV